MSCSNLTLHVLCFMLYYYPHYDVCNHIPKAIPNKAVYGRFRNKSYDY